MANVGVLKLGNISLEKTALFVCDLQEKFQPAIAHFADIVEVTKRLVNSAKILNIPVIVTEQYPKGLGKTVKEVDVNGVVGVFEKTKFSMVVPAVEEAMKSVCGGQLRHVILCGVETHVCVQQTVIDLLERGIDVHVVADGTSSRNQMDRLFALERFRHSGAIVTTSEAVLLQLVQDKDHPKFRDIQAIIKPLAPVSGLVAMY